MRIYMKKATRTATSEETQTIAVVKDLLKDIAQRKETAVREMAAKFDKWNKNVVMVKLE